MSLPFYELFYGQTRTYLIPNGNQSILIDTDWPGTLPQFFKAIKAVGIKLSEIAYVIVTHYHPDHMGLVGELQALGVQLLVFEEQREFLHSSDQIFEKSGLTYQPIDDQAIQYLTCQESKAFFAKLGLDLEVMATPGHSDDSVSIIHEQKRAFVGDLYTLDTVRGYDNPTLEQSWQSLLDRQLETIYYGHPNPSAVRGLTVIP